MNPPSKVPLRLEAFQYAAECAVEINAVEAQIAIEEPKVKAREDTVWMSFSTWTSMSIEHKHECIEQDMS